MQHKLTKYNSRHVPVKNVRSEIQSMQQTSRVPLHTFSSSPKSCTHVQDCPTVTRRNVSSLLPTQNHSNPTIAQRVCEDATVSNKACYVQIGNI